MLPEKIVLASGNKKKLAELSGILAQFEIELIPQTQFDIGEALEDGLTFVENAIKKARYACEHTGLPAIADDSGIEVDCLNGAPGIYSARYAGEDANDQTNLEKLLTTTKDFSPEEKVARYQCVIVYLRHAADPTPIICQDSWEGLLLSSPRGNGGFGYDPIFFDPQSQKTAAQMTPEEKAKVSHRGKALKQFQETFHHQYFRK
ncbi:RdgB/HAM1 family non-canonical purine NTP pyrophosphatase [Aliikangiella marina]|uniref:dITP/XTP pyrophosphatase n=1 Tax=Aliikangiella marina TaxID=1712262 RepID=A0A545TA28_9GAMM|nr:RdgB/HAM1 family non-canonical purine NTP pyrophosphatase [Aliikangiella marina]TQV74057.1 RdgB/HAM1 family non-canonical purine NTP pyrophosphatase [Aliikangiella marina]